MRYTAALLVLVLSAASARMIVCESTCANATLVLATEACHDDDHEREAPLAQLTNGHSCDHSDVVFTLTTSKVTFFERFASSVAAQSYASSTGTSHSIERFAHSLPGATHHSRPQAARNLRI